MIKLHFRKNFDTGEKLHSIVNSAFFQSTAKWCNKVSKSDLSFTNEYYDQSHEWELMSYSYGILDKKNKATGYHFPTLVVSLEVR